MDNQGNFIRLMHDLLFKETFAHPHNRKALEYFLETMLDLKKGSLHGKLKVSYESALGKNAYKDKSLRGDVVVTFDHTIVNIEAYTDFDRQSLNKSTTYIMRITSSIERGQNYKRWDQDKVIQINMIEGGKDAPSTDFASKFVLSNEFNPKEKILRNAFGIWYYRIDKLKTMTYNEDNTKERWARFIGAKTKEEREEISKGDEILMELNEWVEKYVMDEHTKSYFGEWGQQIALDKGKRKGKQEGRLEGRQEEKLNIAKTLLSMGFNKSDIKKATKLTDSEIEKLKSA